MTRRALEGRSSNLNDLWQQVADLGWFESWTDPSVVQFDRIWHESLVLDTVASFEAFLRDQKPECDSSRFEPGETSGTPAELGRFSATLGQDSLVVSSPIDPFGVRVPSFWFESFHLVTIAGAGPDPYCRLSSAMRVPASALAANKKWKLVELIHESHRLGESDLNIACGHTDCSDPESERWWAVGRCDQSVEVAVARASGLSAKQLPHLGYLAKHEDVSFTPVVEELELPRLRGCTAPAWKTWTLNLLQGFEGSLRRLFNDLGLVGSNLHLVPKYLRSRLGK